MENLKWVSKDISKIDIKTMSNEELLSLHDYINKRMFKHASHLIRILKMGIEFLSSGELTVERPENNMLIEIKQGLWTLEQVKKLADDSFKNMELAYINSKLPEKPDYEAASELLITITEDVLESYI
jgi:hypothetical protein